MWYLRNSFIYLKETDCFFSKADWCVFQILFFNYVNHQLHKCFFFLGEFLGQFKEKLLMKWAQGVISTFFIKILCLLFHEIVPIGLLLSFGLLLSLFLISFWAVKSYQLIFLGFIFTVCTIAYVDFFDLWQIIKMNINVLSW